MICLPPMRLRQSLLSRSTPLPAPDSRWIHRTQAMSLLLLFVGLCPFLPVFFSPLFIFTLCFLIFFVLPSCSFPHEQEGFITHYWRYHYAKHLAIHHIFSVEEQTMSSISVITRAGKRIEIIPLADLHDTRTSGSRLRAFCPVHGGDHQRSLSIDRESGWGHCFNARCQATVLVQEFNPEVAERLLCRASSMRAALRPRTQGTGQPPTTSSEMQIATNPASSQEGVTRPESVSREASWQQEERHVLLSLDPLWREALTSYELGDCWQAQAYLHVRGIPLELAVDAGVGYFPISLATHPDVAPYHPLLRRWVERLLFPLTSPTGRGYIGRSLWRWQLGMPENVHKALLEQTGAPRRWIKTNPAGWFSLPPIWLAPQIVLVEGPFDRLALLAGRFRPDEVVALVGTAASTDWFPEHIRSLLLALDR